MAKEDDVKKVYVLAWVVENGTLILAPVTADRLVNDKNEMKTYALSPQDSGDRWAGVLEVLLPDDVVRHMEGVK